MSYPLGIDSASAMFHFGLASTCLVLGPVIFFRRKGDKTHRRLGRSWAAMMLMMNLSALATYDMSGRPNMFHAFALLNLAALIPAWLYIRRYIKHRNPRDLLNHQEMMVWAYFGLFAAGVWQAATTLVRMRFIELPLGLFFSGLGVLTLFASLALARFLAKRRPQTP